MERVGEKNGSDTIDSYRIRVREVARVQGADRVSDTLDAPVSEAGTLTDEEGMIKSTPPHLTHSR